MWLLCMMTGQSWSRYAHFHFLFGFKKFWIHKNCVRIQVGREEPAVSMDASGKIIEGSHSEVQQAILKALPDLPTTRTAVSSYSTAVVNTLSIRPWPSGTKLSARHKNSYVPGIATEDSYFISKFDEAALAKSRKTKEGWSEDGYKDAFDVKNIKKIRKSQNKCSL